MSKGPATNKKRKERESKSRASLSCFISCFVQVWSMRSHSWGALLPLCLSQVMDYTLTLGTKASPPLSCFSAFLGGFAILRIHPSLTLSHTPSPSVAFCHSSEKVSNVGCVSPICCIRRGEWCCWVNRPPDSLFSRGQRLISALTSHLFWK